MAITLMEDVRGGASQCVGIIETHLFLIVVILCLNMIRAVIFQMQILASVIVKPLAGTTVAVLLLIICLKNSTGHKFWTNISKFVANDWPYSELVYILSPIKPSHSGKFTSFFYATNITHVSNLDNIYIMAVS